MGLTKFFKKTVKSATKTIKNPVSVFKRVGQTIEGAYDDVAKFVKDNRAFFGGLALNWFLPGFGMIIAGASIVFKDEANEMFDVVTGRYARDQEDLANQQSRYNAAVDAFEEEMYQLSQNAILPDEIFQIAAANKMGLASAEGQDELDILKDALEAAVAEFNEKYEFVGRTLSDSFFKYFMWLPLIIGGLANDVRKMFKGDIDAFKRIANIAIQVITIAILVIGSIATGGASLGVAMVIIASIVSLVITLDTTYGQGLLMNLIFSTLDFALNEVLQMDEWAGKDFGKLGDKEYYAELTGYVQMAMTIAKIVGVLINPSDFIHTMSVGAGEVAAALAVSTEVIAAAKTFSEVWTYFSYAKQINDIYLMKKASDKLVDMLEEEKTEILTRAEKLRMTKRRQDMWTMSSIQNQVFEPAERIASYIMEGFGNPTSSADPEMLIAGNHGYVYNGDVLEEFNLLAEFNTGAAAGDPRYSRTIIYG